MSNENITDLRGHLFAALRGLTDKTNPMDVDRARAVSDVAQVIINSAKVEIEHMKITGNEKGTGFIVAAITANPAPAGNGDKWPSRKRPPAPACPGSPAPAGNGDKWPSIGEVIEQRPGVTVRRHKLE